MESAMSATNQQHRECQSSRFAMLFILTFISIMIVRENHHHGHIGTTEMYGLFGLLGAFGLFNWWAIVKAYPLHNETDMPTAARAESLEQFWQQDRKLIAKIFRWTNLWLVIFAVCMHYATAHTQPWIIWFMLPYSAILGFKWAIVDMGRWHIRAKWHQSELQRLIDEVARERSIQLTVTEKYNIVDRAYEGRLFQQPKLVKEVARHDLGMHNLTDWPRYLVRGIRQWYHKKYALRNEVELRDLLASRIPIRPCA